MDNLHTLFIVPRLRIQNANAISGNLTWGFPAMSAFIGLMQALERKALEADIQLIFDGVGVVCHDHDAQVTSSGFTRAFRLTRNPIDKTGKTTAIVEEGRIHLDVSLVFAVKGEVCTKGEDEKNAVIQQLTNLLQTMRVAGGTVIPPLERKSHNPWFVTLPDDSQEQYQQFLSIKRRLLPGFALVLRDDLLADRYQELLQKDPTATQLDTWLDLSRLNMVCEEQDDGQFEWTARRPPGWIVPIPVGYAALSEVYPPENVINSRDPSTPFRFVESLYSIGQWVSPHQLKHPQDMLWYVDNRLDEGIYRLNNNYHTRFSHKKQEI